MLQFIFNKLKLHFVTGLIICPECGGHIKLVESINTRKGLQSNLQWKCICCGFKKEFSNSKPKVGGHFEINTRFTYGINLIGSGESGASVLCGILNLQKPVSNQSDIVYNLVQASEEISTNSMNKAADQMRAREGDKVAIAVDGTWNTRGQKPKFKKFTH